jgi:hypothetical protein
MPIRINLLSEALAAEELRRRDPVKRALFIGVLLVALSLVWYSSVLVDFKLAQRKMTLVESEIQSHTNAYQVAQIDQKRIADSQMRLAALHRLNTNRFLQGNLLNALQQINVPNVQLTRLRVDQTYATKAGVAPQTNNFGVVAGRPGTATEKITLTLDARDSGPNPGDQVNRFKEAVTRLDYFQTNLDRTNGVRLLNLLPAQTGASGKPFVLFTLECRFTEKSR